MFLENTAHLFKFFAKQVCSVIYFRLIVDNVINIVKMMTLITFIHIDKYIMEGLSLLVDLARIGFKTVHMNISAYRNYHPHFQLVSTTSRFHSS